MRSFSQWIWVFIFCMLQHSDVISQSGFYKTYDWYEDMEIGYSMVVEKDKVYILVSNFCGNNECCTLAALDFSGELLWKVIVSDIDPGQKGLVLMRNLLLITGNANEPGAEGFRMAYYDKNGNKIGKTHAIDASGLQLNSTFHLSTEVQGDKVFHFGMGNAPKSSSGFSIVTDTIGNILNQYKNVTSDDFSIVFNSFIDRSGTITAISESLWQNDTKDTIQIIKFDDLGNEKKKYFVKKEPIYNFNIASTDLLDGSHILTMLTYNSMRLRPGIRCIDVDNTTKWEYIFDVPWASSRAVAKFKIAENGDFYGAGYMQGDVDSIKNTSFPWLFRMTSSGKLIWSRGFPEYNSNGNRIKDGLFLNFEILEDGSLFLMGNNFDGKFENFIMRVDSSGCVTMNQCGSLNILTKSDPPKISEPAVSIYPNPMQGDQLNISIESMEQKGPYELLIHDILGRLVHRQFIGQESTTISLELPSGPYLVTVLGSGYVVFLDKLVVTALE